MVILPKNYQNALELLWDKDMLLLAGGTDLMVKKRNWAGLSPKFDKDVLALIHLKELDYIISDALGIHIGAMTRLETLLDHPLIPLPLREAVFQMASPAIRFAGTLGGNIANASPAGDTLPILYCYDAQIVIESIEGICKVPIADFIVGPGKTTLGRGEIIKEVIIRHLEYTYFDYKKVGGRKSDAISKLSFIGMANIVEGKLKDIQISFGAVGPTVIRSTYIEEEILLIGGLEKTGIETILEKYGQIVHPIDDQRSNAKYRKICSLNLLKVFLQDLEVEA